LVTASFPWNHNIDAAVENLKNKVPFLEFHDVNFNKNKILIKNNFFFFFISKKQNLRNFQKYIPLFKEIFQTDP
jgi:5'(3')-deoxyribonucleotidase